MLVRMVTAKRRGRSAPIGTPALMACTAASSMAWPPSACTLTSCTPLMAAAESTAPATVLGMSWNFRSRKIPAPSAATSRSEEHTSEQSHSDLVCRLLLEKKNVIDVVVLDRDYL